MSSWTGRRPRFRSRREWFRSRTPARKGSSLPEQREAEERLGAAEATRERTRAMVERARAQATQAQADLARTRALAQRGVATAQAFERDELVSRVAERDLRAAEFQDHAAEHEVDQARALLARYGQGERGSKEKWDVTAPVDGVVLKVLQESETAVVSGTPIIEIADPRDLEIVVDVLSTDALEIHPGATGGAGVLTGQVRRVEPEAFTKISTLGVEEQRVNVIVDLLSPQETWAGLGDGFRVDARITVLRPCHYCACRSRVPVR
jgi:HlyD family secretion protein